MNAENFVRIVWIVFEKIEKSRKKTVFGLILAIFGLILAMFLSFKSYDFDAIAHTRAPSACRMTVQSFMKIVWTVLKKCEIFIERSEEKLSRICGKGVGLGFFPSDSLQSQLYEFIEIAHINHNMV